MSYLLFWFFTARGIINSKAKDTAAPCYFFDDLFGSFNGSFDKIVDGEKYHTAVKNNSPHHELWAKRLNFKDTEYNEFCERKRQKNINFNHSKLDNNN